MRQWKHTFINNSGAFIVLNRYYYHMLVVKPEDSSIVPMDLVNTVESICNPLEDTENK